ncbi:MAG: hypothetical protein R3B70_28015 [Polyangiaceae bacterium]
MKIYEDQIDAMGQAKALEYERRLADFLRQTLAAGNEREVDQAEVRALIAEALSAGLDTERQIAAYVTGAWVFGDDFLARIDPLRPSFSDPCIAPDDKAQLLMSRFDELWLAAGASRK